jgi:hypothetical protein
MTCSSGESPERHAPRPRREYSRGGDYLSRPGGGGENVRVFHNLVEDARQLTVAITGSATPRSIGRVVLTSDSYWILAIRGACAAWPGVFTFPCSITSGASASYFLVRK